MVEADLIVAVAQGNVTEGMAEEIQDGGIVIEAVLVVVEGMMTLTEDVLT